MPAPVLSVRGTFAALRVPRTRDLVFSVKAALSVVLALTIGFSQDLENPYWSALTVYVLMGQPEAGAIRSKALFRLVGTVLGGVASIALAAVFANDVGALLIATILAILGTYYLKTLDRTPASYVWFATPLTLSVVALAQAPVPATIFAIAVTRTIEICLAIVIVGMVDSLVLPRAVTPAFVATMTEWRDGAVAALAEDAPPAWRHRLAALLGPLDALGVQLPYDIVAVPPRARDMRLVRLTVSHLVVDLASADIRVAAGHDPAVGDWLRQCVAFDDPAILEHAAGGAVLRDRLMGRARGADPGDAAMLLRLSELVDHWGRLERVLHAIARGMRLPADLARAAQRARPVRSIDYVLGLRDIAPLALGFAVLVPVWYFTTWTASIPAMLFVFIALGFIIGTPGAFGASKGIVVWIAAAGALALVYQFAVLPRVTAFPVLLAVLLVGLLPFGIMVTMSPAGVLILANGFAFLGLQSAYAADFGATLELVFGSLAGCMVAAAALYLCQFDRSAFRARRLARALRGDLVDVAGGRRIPGRDRLLSLGADRLALYFGAVEGDARMVDTLRLAANLLRLREREGALGPVARVGCVDLREAFAGQFRSGAVPDGPALLAGVEAAYAAVLPEPPGAVRLAALSALIGLRQSLTAFCEGDAA
jgi:uncharacterized membrane protein YccC